jgi:hypothetical protein
MEAYMLYIPFIHKIKKEKLSPPQQIPLFIEEALQQPNKKEEEKPVVVEIELF